MATEAPITFKRLKRDISRRKRELAPLMEEYGTLLRMLRAMDVPTKEATSMPRTRRTRPSSPRTSTRERVVKLTDELTWSDAVMADRIELDDEQSKLLRSTR